MEMSTWIIAILIISLILNFALTVLALYLLNVIQSWFDIFK